VTHEGSWSRRGSSAGRWWSRPGSARADKFDDAHRRLIDLEERTRVLASEFKESPPKDPNAAERRVVDAELQFTLKNYTEAATILLDVIERYPNSHSYDDALVLLGESLYLNRDYTAARTYFEMAVQEEHRLAQGAAGPAAAGGDRAAPRRLRERPRLPGRLERIRPTSSSRRSPTCVASTCTCGASPTRRR
jgi:tetratricopeptide (TPR) repeat protein